jgi:heme-degrading monooxygenase HmoA
MMPTFAETPEPPYYAVVFTSLRSAADADGYAVTADRMVELASAQPGFLGIESVRGADGAGITVSYWSSLEAIRNWRDVAEHRVAQANGRSTWYDEFKLRICRVERETTFVRNESRN